MRTSLTFLTYNRLGLVIRCFRSLLPSLLADEEQEWLIWDNDSSDGTAAWLLKLAKQYPRIKVFLNAQNIGVAGGRQALLEQAQGEIIAFLDSDIEVFNSMWLTPFTHLLTSQPEIGLVGQDGRFAVPPHSQPPPRGYVGEVDVVSGYCQVFKRAVVEEGAHLDMRFRTGGVEDYDFCLQVKALGYQVHSTTAPLRHVMGGTWDGSNLNKNLSLFYQKWGKTGLFVPLPEGMSNERV